ncbi:hypothetical protein MA16_Dca017383 [Dendrobium catenatum]|uniref:Uncharacterized protein n=1 Tax=Dendrobium catenatum TaxID=906689 RepID=A0A2I0VRM0_9ASPA|nr:hypothetical protein MA16_Dca017383 [Dendrobium catenatum]
MLLDSNMELRSGETATRDYVYNWTAALSSPNSSGQPPTRPRDTFGQLLWTTARLTCCNPWTAVRSSPTGRNLEEKEGWPRRKGEGAGRRH